jgi:hypothetical protein
MKMAKKKKYTEALDPHKPHLGGNFIEVNPSTYCPAVWLYIIKKYSIQSVMDVGSGRGHAAKWFSDQGIKTIAVDGLQDNIVNAVYPTVLCDLTESSYNEAVDLVNCIEVVEHIEEKYINNLLDTICSGRYLFMTHGLPGQEGHHHVKRETYMSKDVRDTIEDAVESLPERALDKKQVEEQATDRWRLLARQLTIPVGAKVSGMDMSNRGGH